MNRIDNENDLSGKKLLVLGGTSSSLDLVRLAQKMGAYVIVTDDAETKDRVAKQIADESVKISTNDIDKLTQFIKEKYIDGVFCGPSEFNIKNMIELCHNSGLRCYASPEKWELCSNKRTFKDFCRKSGVLTAQEYKIEDFLRTSDDKLIEYPIIVKPVDGCSSVGISICYTQEDVLKAYEYAMSKSKAKDVIIEQYIDNGGSVFSFRYILDNGEYYPYLTFDTYIADPVRRRCLVSAFTYFPSRLEKTFYESVNNNVQKMFDLMGLKNGVAFIQAIPYNGKIYCHEMGYRLSGGLIYKITEPLMGINDLKMMLRYSLGGEIVTKEELNRIKNHSSESVYAQLMIPLDCGKIESVEGLEDIISHPNVIDFIPYYKTGDVIRPEVYGTLGQHFGRFTLSAKSKEAMIETVNYIQNTLMIKNQDGIDMYSMKFDTNRVLF